MLGIYTFFIRDKYDVEIAFLERKKKVWIRKSGSLD